MKRHRHLISIVVMFITILSCEFESDKEFFREIEKPGDISVGLDLAGVKPNDPVYIYDDTKLYFTLNSAGKKVLNQEIMINGEVLHMTGGDHVMIFKDNLVSDGLNTLKITFRIKTDSGSLADIMNAEYYEGEFIFQLVPVDNALDLSIRDNISDDGFLMLEWSAPSFEQLEVDSYEIKFKDFRGAEQTIVLDGSATSYVDKDYVGGYRSYSITMKFAADKIKDKTVYYNMSYTGITSDDINVEFEDLVSTKVSWKQNRYRCSYFILHDKNDKAVGSAMFNSPEVLLEAPVFPDQSGYYTVIAAPIDMDISEISYNTGGIEKFYNYQAPPPVLNMAVNSFSIENMLIYGRSGNTVKVGDAATLKTTKSYNSPYFEDLTSVSVSPNSSKLLVFRGYNWGYGIDNQIFLYDDKNDLSGTPTEVISPKAESRYQRVDLVDDNLIFIANSHTTDGGHSYHSLINAATGEILQTLECSIYDNIDLSYDAKRLIMTNRSGYNVNIYDINENGFELFKTFPLDRFYEPHELLECIINPTNSDQLFFESNESKQVFVLDVSTGVSDIIDGVFENIDPFTGRVYLFDADWNSNKLMHVYNSFDLEAPAFSFRAWSYGLSVYNDYIMMYQGGLNISKFFK